jgi:LPS export ABC transporter permease LptF/LPS export ABC transporter permease LptG
MMSNRRILERYILKAISPYILVSLILLTAILFAQQTVRYLEAIFHGLAPAGFVYGVALALLPNVLVFTIPMAVLAGTIIGLGRMGSDSELVAMRAAGMSTFRMLRPALALGAIATVAALYLNLQEAPRAQRDLKVVLVRSALYKMDSPVEPRTFTTDIPGQVIYVRDGDKTRGEWGRVFIQSQTADHLTYLTTAKLGRIDASAEKSELVLQDAVRTKLPAPDARDQSYTVERLAQFRFDFNIGRSGLLASMRKSDLNPDEMDWGELRQFAAESTGRDQREAEMLLHKRLAFSVSPLLFALFGAALALRVRRGGRGLGVLLSLLVLLIYYLFTLAGDQMARAGSLPAGVGPWLASALTLAIAIGLLAFKRREVMAWFTRTKEQTTEPDERAKPGSSHSAMRQWLVTFPSLLDLSLLRALGISFLIGFLALVMIFNIFTIFELWRFIASNAAPVKVVAQYLYYLLPLVSVEIFPGSVLVAVLMTYALTARRREAVAWWASGQSVYRLMLPGLAFALLIGFVSWSIQERVMPEANVRQDNLRAKIKGISAQLASESERRWLVSADGARIFSYEFDDRRQMLLKPSIYDFDSRGVELTRVISGEAAKWLTASDMEISGAHWINLDAAQVSQQSAESMRISGVDPPAVFRPTVDRPSQLSAERLSSYIRTLKQRGAETAPLAVALQRKYAAPFSVIVMALVGMPLAISFGRKTTVLALCAAVVVSLLFWLVSGGFQQLGEHALLPPAVAAWTPVVIFAGGALYFISRVRT